MKKHSKRSARVSSKKVTISNHAKGSTSQAGLIPVVKFLRKAGIIGLVNETVDYERDANALYDCADAVLLTVIATIGGARSLSSVTTIWADGVLRRLAGLAAIPDNRTLGRLLRKLRERQVSQLETLNHRLRGKFWKKALRSGASTIKVRLCRVIDVDSTVKTAYGKQQGIKKDTILFTKAKRLIIPFLLFGQRPKKSYRVGLEVGMPIPAMES